MGVPANIRVNTAVPFPALVTSSGPITIAKVSGIWTVGFSIANLATQNPPSGNYPTDYVIVWDSVAGSFIKVSLTNLAVSTVVSQAPAYRKVTATPIVVNAVTDQVLGIDTNAIAGASACALPAAAGRSGVPLTFKDITLKAATWNITLTPNGAETIDTLANLVMKVDGVGVTLLPVTGGWIRIG
jgi:hypothetical protein